MKIKKVDQKNTKKINRNKLRNSVEEKPKITSREADEIEEHPEIVGAPLAMDDVDVHLNPDALAEEEPTEIPDEVGFDDLTDDEREMLGLEAKPKVVSDDGEENTGASWEEFGYDEEELS